MTTSAHTQTPARALTISGLRVAVVRKNIKNLHLGVYPPDGRVRVAAPLAVSDAAVRVAVIGKLRWIGRQRAAFAEQAREDPRAMVSGESHYFLGRRYRLEVVVGAGPRLVRVKNSRVLQLRTTEGDDIERRAILLQRWYREQLREILPPMMVRWQHRLGVSASTWGIKRMKTKWGSCNAGARRIWLNLELAKKSPECIEYVLVHELAHLLAPHHDERFQALMDRHAPRWRQRRKELNAAPLARESWDC
jgi:predicted metal-dependent hydrolase